MTALRYPPAAEQGLFTTLLCSLGGHSLILLLWLLWPASQSSLPSRPLMVRIVAEEQPLLVAKAVTRPSPVLNRPQRQSHPLPPAIALPDQPAQPETSKTDDNATIVSLPAETAMADPSPIAVPAEAPANLAIVSTDAPPNTTAERDAYLQTIRQRIEAHRDYPLLARKGRQQGRAIVRFRLDRQGVLNEAWLAVPSGSSLLDRAALRAVAEAAPFPPPPAGIDIATTFDAPVTFRLDR